MPAVEPKEEFLNYIQNHPAYYPLLQSEIFVQVLEFLAAKARPLPNINSYFSAIESKDLNLVLNSLIALKLVTKIESKGHIIYYANQNGKELLGKFKKAKKHFKIA